VGQESGHPLYRCLPRAGKAAARAVNSSKKLWTAVRIMIDERSSGISFESSVPLRRLEPCCPCTTIVH
jgi:hypothetical protein